MLTALAGALRLDHDEHEHLLALAGHAPPSSTQSAAPGPAQRHDPLGRVPGTAALVLAADYDVLAWNALAAALLEAYSAVPSAERNLVRRHVLPPAPLRRYYGMSGADDFSRYAVGQLRSASARYPTDRALSVLVAGLRAESQEFAALWDSGDVPIGQHRAKSVDHPLAGHLDLSCDVLTIPDRDQQLVLLTAAPGSPSERALHRLTPDRVPDCTLAINPVEESLVLNDVAPGEPTAD